MLIYETGEVNLRRNHNCCTDTYRCKYSAAVDVENCPVNEEARLNLVVKQIADARLVSG